MKSLGFSPGSNWWGITDPAYGSIPGGCSIGESDNPHLNKLTTVGEGRSDLTAICKGENAGDINSLTLEKIEFTP